MKNININKLLKNNSYILLFAILFLTSALNLSAQNRKVLASGIITDENNEALIGASIVEKGTGNGVTSDFEGRFEIAVNEGSTLEISFISYETKSYKIDNNTVFPLMVNMSIDSQTLQEIELVDVGYGTMRKKDLTGAIANISSENLVTGVMASTEQVLQGKIAGLTVSSGSGDPSSGSSMRLRGGTSLTASNSPLVVVNGIPGVDINTVQPADIKSIDVLKDASATAIYGSRGANGVIIITTKNDVNVSKISYSGLAGVSASANNLDLLSANQWRKYVRENNVEQAIDFGADTNWQEELQQIALNQSHNVNFISGGENNGVRASVNYLEKEGIIQTTNLERLAANISGYQYSLNKRLKIDIGVNVNVDKWHPLDYRIFQRAYNLNPTIPVYGIDGNFSEVGGTLYENPVEIMTNRIADDKRNRLLAYSKFEYEIIEGLKFQTNVSYENNRHQGNLYKPSYAVLEGRTENGYARKSEGEYTNKQLETFLSYNKLLEEHSMNFMGGYSFLENVYEGFGAQRSGFDTDLFGYNNLGSGQDYRIGDVYSYKGMSRLVSFYLRANYSYAGKYMFTSTVRYDGSSRFGANNKWGLFPSASVAWRISDEDFMDFSDSWLNSLKLRAGYGITGNQDGIGEYKSLSILGVGNDSYYDPASDTWKLAYSPVQNPNPDLKWESTAQLNIGVDFSLFDRVNGSLEFYNKVTSDLLYTYEVPQPPYLVGTMLANVGQLSNKGVELTLGVDIINNENFRWTTDIALAHNKQKIDKLSNQVYETDVIYSGSLHGLSGMSNQYSQIIKEGYPVGTFYGYKNSGLDDNGMFILSDEKEVLGDIQPWLNAGLSMNFSWYDFDFGFTSYGSFGQKVLNATNMILYDPNRLPAYNVPDDFLESGINSDPTFSDFWIEDASFFRLQTVSLGYNVKSNSVFSNMRFYILGENLAILTSYKGIDPEVNMGGLASPGIDRFNVYPKPRTLSIGLNFTLNND